VSAVLALGLLAAASTRTHAALAATSAAAFTSDRSTTYQVDAAHAGNVPHDSLAPPLIKEWSDGFSGPVSYPVVADGMVFVTAANSGTAGSALYALNQTTGATIWGPFALGGNSNWSALTYDRGRIFAVDNFGKISAFDAASGSQAWSENVELSSVWDGPPVGFGGFLYVRGDNGIHVLNELDGSQYATAGAGNIVGSPAVSPTGMFITDPCNTNWDFDPLSGATIWHISGSCSGGGGTTPVLYANRVYTRDVTTGNWILDAATGSKLGTYTASTIPAFNGNAGFYLSGSKLTATNLGTRNPVWTFTGDGTLDTAPLVVAGLVYVGGSSGNLYVLDASTGALVGGPYAVGAGFAAPQEVYSGNSTLPLTGLAAGGGWLDVSAGSKLVAYTSTINVSEGDINFSRQPAGTTIASSVTVTNFGVAPSSISGISATAPFQQTNDCGALGVNASCTINVDYLQTGGPAASGSLTFNDGGGGSHKLPLSSDASDGFPPPPAMTGNRIITAFGSDGSGAALSRGQYPYALAAAPSHVYIGDFANPVVRDLNRTTGMESAFAGDNGFGEHGDGGQATSAMVSGAGAIARCTDGTYFADTYNYVIRKVDGTGRITKIAGTGVPGYSGDGGPATDASISRVFGLACRTGGGLYISDSDNGAVRIVDASGNINTWWYGFSFPTGLAEIGATDSAVVSDAGADNIVWSLTDKSACVAAGAVTVDIMCAVGPATSQAINDPRGLLYSGNNVVYLAERGNNAVVTIDLATESMSIVAGNGQNGFSGDGGLATAAELSQPSDIAVADNTLYIADGGSFHVRAVDLSTHVITTIAGNGTASWSGDGGPANDAQLAFPYGVAVDQFGNAYVPDNLNEVIRKVDRGGAISTYAGNGAAGFYDNTNGASASFNDPRGIAVDNSGNVYVADTGNNRIRIIYHANDLVTTVAGNGTRGFSGDGGPATSAMLNAPRAVVVDPGGNIFIADTGNNRVREVTPAGTITTVAGTGSAGYSGDGALATSAMLNAPRGLALDALGDLYVSDTGNNRVRRVDHATKVITTVAGNGSAGVAGDGRAAKSAELDFPFGLAFDSAGNLLIADSANFRIRLVDPTGEIHTVVASCGVSDAFVGDGGPPGLAQLNQPYGIAVDSNDDLFIADSANNRVREASINSLGREPTCPGSISTPGSRGVADSAGGPPGPRLPDLNRDSALGSPVPHAGGRRIPTVVPARAPIQKSVSVTTPTGNQSQSKGVSPPLSQQDSARSLSRDIAQRPATEVKRMSSLSVEGFALFGGLGGAGVAVMAIVWIVRSRRLARRPGRFGDDLPRKPNVFSHSNPDGQGAEWRLRRHTANSNRRL
jgi:outer membrane protein assembly factor BamB